MHLPVPRHYQADADLAAFVAALPKTETHLHLEGSVTYEQLHAADPQRWPEPPPFWDPNWRFESFDAFQTMFNNWIIPYHTSVERYHQTATRVFARCAAEGCRYVETSIHLPGIAWLGCDGPELLDAITEAAPPGLEVRIFGGMSHIDYAEHGALLDRALGWDKLAGIDLHGPEYLPVDAGIPELWRRARAHGKLTKAHAGEFMPASFVDWVVDNLDVDRIEHGVRAVESAAVMQRLAQRGTVLDVCPISNLKLAVDGVETMAQHPIRRLMEAGIKVTVSCDDTFLFGNCLAEEYYALATDLGFTRRELVGLARNGFEVALLDEATRTEALDELDRIEAGLT